MELRLLDYFDVIKEIDKVTKTADFKKMTTFYTIHDHIEIPYYTLGNGDNHILIVGGTHGSEIISTDFVLRVMSSIGDKKGIFKDLELNGKNGFTFHFLPLHNPEGYIVSTSALRKLIPKDISENDMESISKDYFDKYRQDDINVKNNPDDRSKKLHQQMFENVGYDCISPMFSELRESIKRIYSNPKVPAGSIVVHRGNGLGEETNRASLFKDLSICQDSEYYNNRYNNISRNIPGPLGIRPKKTIIENKLLKSILNKLFVDHKYAGMISYHSTGGMIYSKISNDEEELFDDIDNKYKQDKYNKSVINSILSKNYQNNTKYITSNGVVKNGYKIVSNPNLSDFDEWLRNIYPACLLVELSYMGGNPIGPLGDKDNNYVPTMESNMNAIYDFFQDCRKLKPAMYNEVLLIENEVDKIKSR